jgi:hypothetical protein
MKSSIRYILAGIFFVVTAAMFYLSSTESWTLTIGGVAFIYAAMSLLREPSSTPTIRKPGMFHEADYSVSMRRVSAAFLFVSAVALFGIGAWNDHQYAFFGGLACLIGGILMLFFTTWSDFAQVTGSIGGLFGRGGLASRPATVPEPKSAVNVPVDPSVGG